MDPSSPAKRRALAPLDKNAMSPTTKLGAKPTPQLRGTSPSKPSGLKRPLQVFGADENGAAKKQCQEPQDAAPPSAPVPEEVCQHWVPDETCIICSHALTRLLAGEGTHTRRGAIHPTT